MCYETAQLAYRIYKEAERIGADHEEVERLRKKWERLKERHPEFYHVKGFDHPDLAVLTKAAKKIDVDLYQWGLIPPWAKDIAQAKEISNKTLNARGETLFEKSVFREAAHNHRCIIPLNGFYEHHHKNKLTFPYYIQAQNEERLLVGGVSSEWNNPLTGQKVKTFSIVTTPGNEFMSKIHNNPKMAGPRMPLILNPEDAPTWLQGNDREAEKLIHPNTEIVLKSHTVERLNGHKYKGNTPEVRDEKTYTELIDPPTLFDF